MKATTTRTKILAYMAKNPEIKVKDVALKFNVSTATVYLARGKGKKEIAVAPSAPAPAPAPEFAPNIDLVNHPDHYKVGGIETIDFIEAKKLNYHLGNVVKYITRADHKDNRLQDLQKAMWYLTREIKRIQA